MCVRLHVHICVCMHGYIYIYIYIYQSNDQVNASILRHTDDCISEDIVNVAPRRTDGSISHDVVTEAEGTYVNVRPRRTDDCISEDPVRIRRNYSCAGKHVIQVRA